MKNDCGHPVGSEESVLRCCDCEAETRKRDDDATWNAAIEAAAMEAKAVMNAHPHRLYSAAVKSVAEAVERIRALKREAK